MFQETRYQIGVPCVRVSGLLPKYLAHGALSMEYRTVRSMLAWMRFSYHSNAVHSSPCRWGPRCFLVGALKAISNTRQEYAQKFLIGAFPPTVMFRDYSLVDDERMYQAYHWHGVLTSSA